MVILIGVQACMKINTKKDNNSSQPLASYSWPLSGGGDNQEISHHTLASLLEQVIRNRLVAKNWQRMLKFTQQRYLQNLNVIAKSE